MILSILYHVSSLGVVGFAHKKNRLYTGIVKFYIAFKVVDSLACCLICILFLKFHLLSMRLFLKAMAKGGSLQ